MMNKIFFWFFLFPTLLFAQSDSLFLGGSDPLIVEDVNVITGHLNLHFEDERVLGPVSISINRTYCSGGADVCEEMANELRKASRTLFFESGWSLEPHLQMLVDPRNGYNDYLGLIDVYLAERSGGLVSYRVTEKQGKDILVFKPRISGGQGFGEISGLTNPKNHRIELNFKKGKALVYLANGGYRIYKGEYFSVRDNLKNFSVPLAERKLRYYRLEEERLPSGHYILYQYQDQKKSQLLTISLVDPTKTKRYAQIEFFIGREEQNVFSQRGKLVDYKSFKSKERRYLEKVELLGKPKQLFGYKESSKGRTDLLETMSIGGLEELRVEYYKNNKVQAIKRLGVSGAQFFYEPNFTDVRNAQNILTRYHHSDGNLHYIEYFDEKEDLVSTQKFFWSNGYLVGKAMCNSEGMGVFSKIFSYDDFGNVIEESLYGNLSGLYPASFEIDEWGRLQDAEKYTKIYRYDNNSHLLIEEEDKGLIYRYSYKHGTNLLTKKETYFENLLLKKESWLYDDENLLIETVVDDGVFSKVVEFENDKDTGLCKAKHEKQLRRSEYKRGFDGQIIEERVYDCHDEYCYTLYTEYDAAGRVLRKTTPSGLENRYEYDFYGRLIESKEVGSPRKSFKYDNKHRCTSASQNGKHSKIGYDLSGNIRLERDFKGLEYHHQYDCFGKRLRTSIPLFGQEIFYEYDVQGNLIKKRSLKGHVTKIAYTIFKKPSYIETPDGAITKHRYNLSGSLNSTRNSDQTLILYEYDPLDRMIAKKIYGSSNDLLSEEKWGYKGSLLEVYTEKTGLEIRYSYDSFGRLIEENRGGRVKSYTYDSLGFLETTKVGDIIHTQIHDFEGRVVEEVTGVENYKFYLYNEENQKIEATTVTSVGEAIDFFEYDPAHRVALHKSPNGAITTFEYENFSKTTTDPLGNSILESYDLLGRVKQIEKRDQNSKTSFLEEFEYDLEGNKILQRSYIYGGEGLDRVIEVSFSYDSMGRLIEQIEEGDKRTSYKYDSKGRIISQTKPDGITVYRTYDGLDRITSLKTKDGSVFYTYFYDRHDQPIEIKDQIQKNSLFFSYNLFSEVIKEGDFSWGYDDIGRVTKFQLPDDSFIAYTYKDGHMQSVKRFNKNGSLLYEHEYTHFDLNGHVQKEKMIASLGEIKTKRDLLERITKVSSPYAKEEIAYNLIGLITGKKHTLLEKKEYSYDSLYQLTKDGDETYNFDSLGNRLEDIVNEYNQVIQRGDDAFVYDLNGNLIQESVDGQTKEYTYDGLDRLISITTPKERKVLYEYDALSRLFSKETFSYYRGEWESLEKKRYLYDKEVEIGSIDEKGSILELKVVGLGIRGEVGGAVALELGGIVYAPLHDVNGNIIAIIDPINGEIEETYQIDSFGHEIKDQYKSPWRFSSKREEEDLFFFGCRFYHPELSRFLTPDPLGFKESRNPYLFVLNSPINRLDPLGLLSLPNFYFDGNRDRYYGVLSEQTIPVPIGLKNLTTSGRVQTNIICIHDRAHVLNFSKEEIAAGQFNLLDHLDEIIPPQGEKIGMILYGNGMNTNKESWSHSCITIGSLFPEGPVLLSLYNPTEGIFKDLMRVLHTFKNYENDRAEMLRQLHVTLLKDIHEKNNNASILNIVYSEGALNYFAEFQRMADPEQKLLQSHFLVNTIGAPRFSPKNFGKNCVNYFSDKDYIAKISGKQYMNNPEYVIKEVPSLSKGSDMLAGFIDHGILAPTYMQVMRSIISKSEKDYGFYKKSDR
jgi:RHS repeat-associated protein